MLKSFRKVALLIAMAACSFFSFSDEPEKIRIGYFYDNVFHIGQSNTEIKKGYGYEYYTMIANYTGWTYEYFYGSKAEIYEAFLAGKIDLIDAIGITDERQKLMNFSALPMGEEKFYIFVPMKDPRISMLDITTLNGKKIGVNKGTINETLLENFLSENKIKCEIVGCKDTEDRLEKIAAGKIDAMVTSDGFSMNGFRPTFPIGTSPIYFAVKKDRPDILKKLNSAMKHNHEINPNYNNILRYKFYKKIIARTVFSSEEISYIKEHPVIKIGYRAVTMPFCGEGSKEGEVAGLLSDILNHFESVLKIKFEAKSYLSNTEMIDDLKNGIIDCAYPVMDDVWLSEMLGYTQTSPVARQRMVMIFKDKYKGIESYKKFGYTIGSPCQHVYAIEHNMGKERIGFKSEQETLRALQKGNIDFTLMNILGWNYWTKTFTSYDDLSYVVLEDDSGYSFAIQKQNTNLFSILESAISQLDEHSIADSINRNSQSDNEYSLRNFIRHNVQLCFVFVLIIFVITIFLVIIYERNSIHKKMLTFKAEHDVLTGVYNRCIIQKADTKSAQKICIAVIDIDDFKNINDKYGHEMGNEVIKKVARQLTLAARNSDKVIRYGGDEFLVIFNGIDKSQKEIIMDKFQKIQEALGETSETAVKSSISVGMAFSEIGYTSKLFDLADEALYKSKSAGKHMLTISDSIITK